MSDSTDKEPGQSRGGRRQSPLDKLQARTDEVLAKRERQLPLWPEDQRSAPNEMLRSALFTARNRNQAREQKKSSEIATYGNTRIIYTGEELRQDDHDVWLQILHMAKDLPLGEPLYFRVNALKKELDMPFGKDSTERLKEILTRLKATALVIHSDRLGKGVGVSLLSRFEYNESETTRDAEWMVQVDPEMALLFGEGVYTSRMQWMQRKSLTSPLAKWLHGFYSSHKDPFPMTIATLMGATGTAISSNYKATQLVKKNLEELVRVEFLESFSVTKDGRVSVVRKNKVPKG